MTSPVPAEVSHPRRAIVDAHHHFWDLSAVRYPWLTQQPWLPFRYGDYARIRRNYLYDDYRGDTSGFRVDGTVHMEAESAPDSPCEETQWLAEQRLRHGLPCAAVAQAWLDRPDVEDILSQQSKYEFVRGVRHKPAAAPDTHSARRGRPGSMDDPVWRRGFALLSRFNFSFDLQTPPWELAAAADLARDFPRTTIIVNHAGLPMDRSAEGLTVWRHGLESVASCPNVHIKLSGIGLPGRWPVEENRGIVRIVLETFGYERCLFASNFPVDSLTASFRTIYQSFQSFVADYSDHEQDALFRANAIRLYRFDLVKLESGGGGRHG
jgi:predicted TIM-barrel fold metal-dependent hydrolase